ncbi:cephalosporin hydroxylase [Methylorubrum extorquens]|jgi:cephalosporin hydroxylase
MTLLPCSDLFGEASVFSIEPSVQNYDEAIFRPMSKTIFLDKDNGWGLYAADGLIIDEAAYRRGSAKALVGQSEIYYDDCDVFDSNESCVYFGPIIPHYGHFLVTTLARLWFVLREVKNGRKLLVHSDHRPEDYFANPYMGPLLRAAGLSVENFTSPAGVTRYRNILVPSPAFVEQLCAFRSYVEPMHAIGQVIIGDRIPARTERFAYLSKSKLPKGSVAKIMSEDILEKILSSSNFDVIYPESLSLEEQISVFYKYKAVVGFVGSAFHSHIFCDNPSEIYGLSLESFINSNLVLLDRLNGVKGAYLDSTQHLIAVQEEGYLITKQIKDPGLMAREILSAIGAKSPEVHSAVSPRSRRKNGSSSMSLFSHFLDNNGRPIHKSGHYFFAYERHFAKYKGQPCTFLEIGAGNGGSSQMWKRWFGPLTRIVTIDINPVCQQYSDEQVEVRIGDQSDPVFLQSLLDEFGTFDAVLDDGSHHMDHVPATFEFLYPRIAPNGVYMIEDMHTAYWANYGGGLGAPNSMVEHFKHMIDRLNATHVHDGSIPADDFTRSTLAMTAYDSILVFEKTPYANKIMRIVGDENLRVNY